MILFDVLITSIFGAGGSNNRNEEDPNFYNVEAYVTLNPYAQSNLYGQYSWFAWGRFYEIYGYSPGFIGDGWDCVDQLIATHIDNGKNLIHQCQIVYSRELVIIMLELLLKSMVKL